MAIDLIVAQLSCHNLKSCNVYTVFSAIVKWIEYLKSQVDNLYLFETIWFCGIIHKKKSYVRWFASIRERKGRMNKTKKKQQLRYVYGILQCIKRKKYSFNWIPLTTLLSARFTESKRVSRIACVGVDQCKSWSMKELAQKSTHFQKSNQEEADETNCLFKWENMSHCARPRKRTKHSTQSATKWTTMENIFL